MAPQRGTTDDLTKLSDLDDSSLLEELHQRYRRDVIYTYIGDILVSVNPYKNIPIYGEEVGQRYAKATSLQQYKPHIYAIGSRAFHNIQRGQGDQCLLVSGKTEVTKMLVAQIVRMSQWEGDFFLQEKIIEVNPLLEAFGNAATRMNDNSSRFGKLIELVFSETGQVLGARITEHMLEKSRVTRRLQDEKNFHIFYNVMCGFSAEERQRYFLEPPEKYRILDPGHGVPVIANEVEYGGYTEAMNNIRRIMPIVGFADKDMDVVFALLAAILHLCNIEMAVEPESDEVIVMNEDEIDYAAILLSVQAEDLITCLLANVNWVRGERVVQIKSLNQATDGRDAVAKALYRKLFSWIVQQINWILHVDDSTSQRSTVISILDMAGFENFAVNSFEQLCINCANERLQHYFSEHIFTLELGEYHVEGIKQPKVKYNNNRELLALFFARPLGLFSLLEEECRLARATDVTLLEKLNKHFVKHSHYKKPKHGEPIFTVVHYAGLVTYHAMGFLQKNRDTLSTNMQSLMENSHNNLVNELFTAKVLDTGTLDMRGGSGRSIWGRPTFAQPEKRQFAPGDSLSRQAGKKLKQKMKDQNAFQDIGITANPNSSSAHFKNSLQHLMDKLQVAEPTFIRCIKPNLQKLSNSFDPRVVMDQLRSTGVLETTRIRKLGYCIRLPFETFFQRYRFIAFPAISLVQPGPGSCIEIIKSAKLKDVQIGNSKVFLKYWHVDSLNSQLDVLLHQIVQVQASVRTYLARRQFLYHAHLLRHHQEMVVRLCDDVANAGDSAFMLLENQANHDFLRDEKAKQERDNIKNRQRGPLSDQKVNPGAMRVMPDVFSPDISVQDRNIAADFYENAIGQVINKFGDIDADVWCKILYMEYDRPVAKFYICDREVTIDGSADDFSGKKIGLGAFNNPARDERTEKIRSYIGKGISLKNESDGSVSATRLGKNDVIVKGFNDPANHCISADVIKEEGSLPLNIPMKVFDMEEFKSHIGIEMRSAEFDRHRLQLLSVVGLSLISDDENDLSTPCWLCLISLQALENIDNIEVKKEVQQKFAELSLRDQAQIEEKQALQDMAGRHQRNWSKLNQRQAGKGNKEPLRKTRLQIKQKGENVQDVMNYSWDNEPTGRQLKISELEEGYDRLDDTESIFLPVGAGAAGPSRGYSIASSAAFSDISKAPRKDWAKIKVTVKQETIQEREAQKPKHII